MNDIWLVRLQTLAVLHCHCLFYSLFILLHLSYFQEGCMTSFFEHQELKGINSCFCAHCGTKNPSRQVRLGFKSPSNTLKRLRWYVNLYFIMSAQTIIVKSNCLLYNKSVCIYFSSLLQSNKNIFEERKTYLKGWVGMSGWEWVGETYLPA